MKPVLFLTLGLACGLTAISCKPVSRLDQAPEVNVRKFYVKGVIRQLGTNGRSVVIEHEDIPDYMETMTMPFRVKQTNELAGLEPGQLVLFRLMVTEDESWIDQVTRLPGAGPEAAAEETTRQVRWVEPLHEGDPLPHYPLTNQLGRAFGLTDFKGEVLVFTFIYTRCPLPEFCPRMTAHLTEVQQRLKAASEAPKGWRLLTISFDPEHDTPLVLKAYAEDRGCDPERWVFATGAREEIDALTEQFGLSYGRIGETFDHNLRTVVVAPHGRIHRILIGNEWSPDELYREVLAAAS